MTKIAEAFQALADGTPDVLRRLLDEDPGLAGARNEQGVSLLMQAAYVRQPEAQTLLLAGAPELDVFESAAYGRSERIDELLGARPELARARSADGFTPLHLACFFAQPEAARRLLQAGADVDARAENPNMKGTALHSAAAARRKDLVELLLEHGADPDARQEVGFTALHSAALHGDREMVGRLLAAGADPSLAADDGRTPSDFAREGQHPELAARLEERNQG